nr:hypothetical protein CFP56_36190 [Quercus suber]
MALFACGLIGLIGSVRPAAVDNSERSPSISHATVLFAADGFHEQECVRLCMLADRLQQLAHFALTGSGSSGANGRASGRHLLRCIDIAKR